MSIENIIETVEVQRDKTPQNPSGVVIINKCDLSETDVLVGAEPVKVVKASNVTTPTATPEAVTPAPWAKPAE